MARERLAQNRAAGELGNFEPMGGAGQLAEAGPAHLNSDSKAAGQ
jgi:hypothetical protein